MVMFTRPPWSRYMMASPARYVGLENIIVDSTPGGHPEGSAVATTLAAAEAALPSTGGVVVVKSGTYAGATLAKGPSLWIFEPGCIINTTALTVSGNKVGLDIGIGCDIQVAYTHSGDDGWLSMRNNADSDGLAFTGDRPYIDGGGLGTLHDGASTREGVLLDSCDDALILNARVKTAGGGSNHEISVGSSLRAVLSHLQSVDAGSDAINIGTLSGDALVLGCNILDSDDEGVELNSPRGRVIGSHVAAVGSIGLRFFSNSDNGIAVGNVVEAATGDEADLAAGTANQVVVGNRISTVIDDDSGGTATVAGNDLS